MSDIAERVKKIVIEHGGSEGTTELVIVEVAQDPRFLWVRGIDQRRFIASMLSVPLVWNDRIVGVLNVQTEQPRDFSTSPVSVSTPPNPKAQDALLTRRQ